MAIASPAKLSSKPKTARATKEEGESQPASRNCTGQVLEPTILRRSSTVYILLTKNNLLINSNIYATLAHFVQFYRSRSKSNGRELHEIPNHSFTDNPFSSLLHNRGIRSGPACGRWCLQREPRAGKSILVRTDLFCGGRCFYAKYSERQQGTRECGVPGR